jgi:phosphate starvation-inducible protein PhoH and related proteins
LSKRRNRAVEVDYFAQPSDPRFRDLKSTRSNRKPFVPDHLQLVTDTYSHSKRTVELIPKSLNQETYIDLLTDDSKLIIFATGPAGTGKTMLAVMAAIKAYKEGTCKKIVITRPAVGVDDEQHGFLPGTLNQKMEPWTRPIMDVFAEYYKPAEITRMLDEQIIEVSPLAFMRGRTFKNAWVILDEAQNVTVNQMKMALTRIGNGSKMIVTGDLQQKDRKFVSDDGLGDFLSRLTKHKSNSICEVNFTKKDVQRHPVIAEVLGLYGEES